MVEWVEVGLLIACACLMPCAGVGGYSNAVDIFNVTSGNWSTAVLSVARSNLAATSLPNLGVAIFAGGESNCCHVDFFYYFLWCLSHLGSQVIDWAEVVSLIACASLTPCAVGGWSSTRTVDIFNVTSGAWSTAALSSDRRFLGATSLPNLGIAIFAGGNRTCCHVDFGIFGVCVFLRIGRSDG
jgi:hypothetical protein